MKTLTKQYEIARLAKPKSGIWFIEWYNLNKQGELQRIRKTFNINRITDLREREGVAAQIITVINNALEAGYNHLHQEQTVLKEKYTLNIAIKQALNMHLAGLKPESHRTYKSVAGLFCKWATANGLDKIPVENFAPANFQAYLDSRAGKSAKNINQHIVLIRQLFDKIKDVLELIERNPTDKFKLHKEQESTLYQALTKEELLKINDYLRARKELQFYCFIQFVFYAYIRPGHLPALKRSQIDFEANEIHIIASETKSGRNAVKQLLQPLKETLLALGVDKLAGHCYIFGRDFAPSAKPYPRLKRTAGERWKKMVEDIGIDKKLYALKHTSGQMYLNDNEHIDADWLSAQMEHKTLAETATYIKARKVKKIDESKVKLPKL